MPARGISAPIEAWYPAGPSMDTVVPKMYDTTGAEFNDFGNNLLDFPDAPLTDAKFNLYQPNPNYFVTNQAVEGTVSGIDFNMANNFWGCTFDYGTSLCGVLIRQGLAHLIDKTIFSTVQVDLAGHAIPIDSPAGPTLLEPNPCSWDSLFPQVGANCVVGTSGLTGGVAYHLAPAAACGLGSCSSTPTRRWIPGFGTPDFCAAADHFIAAGRATGKVGGVETGTCVLTGLTSGITAFPAVRIFARSDNSALGQLGESIAQAICALFTGTFSSTTCGIGGSNNNILVFDQGPIFSFTGFNTGPPQPNITWWIYTFGAGSYVSPGTSDQHWTAVKGGSGNLDAGPRTSVDATWDLSQYRSDFVSAGPFDPNHQICASSTSSYTAPNYGYLCDRSGSGYDVHVNEVASAPCISAPGDPTPGQTSPTFANCPAPNSSQQTLVSAGYNAEDVFGRQAYGIPVFAGKDRYVYGSNWLRGIFGFGGTFSYFTWLNAYSSTPQQAGTIRQGFGTPPANLNPYIARSPGEVALVRAVYDSPNIVNPMDRSQLIDWMTISTQVLQNSQLTYIPPAGTVQTYRFTLRNDIFWQGGFRKVTAWDAKFSYATQARGGSYFGSALQSMVCTNPTDPSRCVDGINVISPTQFDVHVTQAGVATQALISSIPILPGRLWSIETTGCGATKWDQYVDTPQFNQFNVPDSCMDVDRRAKASPTFDPIASGTFIGSSSWVCKSSGGVVGSACSSTGTQSVSPGGTFTLQRYGLGSAPGASLNAFFRSSGNLALYIWTGNTGDFTKDFLNFGVVSLCFGQSLLPLGTTTGCGHWQQGIGAPLGHYPVSVTQVAIVQRFVGVNWVSPYNWVSSPPSGIASFPPVLHEGSATLNPASTAGCGSPYPTGGYDC